MNSYTLENTDGRSLLGMTTVLFISLDSDIDCRILQKLKTADITIVAKKTFADSKEALATNAYPVSIIRCQRLTVEVIEMMSFFKINFPQTKIILNVETGSVEDAVLAMKNGAADFLICDCCDARLTESVLKNVTSSQSTRNSQVPFATNGQTPEAEVVLVGRSPAICEIRSAVNLVAKSQTNVLITGESGTGKEVVARLIHNQSSRAQKAFIALNCSALPKDVIENELFGHEKGAFTGALLKKAGCFELAHGGSLLFDEIAEMSPDTQAKLLRAIETQKFRRLGGKEEVKVDVRVIAATNKNISSALKSKELREDLYYRVSVIEIFIPPLRERKEDIPLLVDYFLTIFSMKYGKPRQNFNEESMEILCDYDWPGNVREIRNIVERALVICPDEHIEAHYLPEKMQRRLPTSMQFSVPIGSSAQQVERMLILQTLAAAGNNKAKTAKILGISRKTIHNKLQSFSQE
jgi:DNA-binding NtrC family response regulator